MTHTTRAPHPRKPQKTKERNIIGDMTRHLRKALVALGHGPDSVVSTCTQLPGDTSSFRAETRTVKSLKAWQPPKNANVWFSPNPLRLDPGVPRKGGVADVAQGLTLYADLDVLTPGLKDKGLASLAECELVVDELTAVLGVAPSVIIYSGHGLQPVWRIGDAEPITDGAVAWNTISARWSALVRQVAIQVNPDASVDSVFNIDRVLRCPGSTNWKDPEKPVRVRCVVNSMPEALAVERLDKVLPAASDAAVHAVHPKGSSRSGRRVLDSFRSGPMSPSVVAKVNDVVVAVEAGEDRHAAMNAATMSLVRLGAKGERGVAAALNFVEAAFSEVSDTRDPAEFQRSLDGALRVVAGDPNYTPLDFRGSQWFLEDGSLDPESPLAQSLREIFESDADGRDSRSDRERVRFEAVPASALSGPIPPMQWLIKGVWALNSFGPLGGEKKTLKSYNLLSMSVAVASGLPFYGEFEVAHPGPVLYFAGEGGRDEHQRRLQAIAGAYGVPLDELPLHTVFDTGGMDEPEFLEALDRHLDVLQPRLVVLDPLYAFHARGIEAQNLYDRGRMLSDFNARVGSETSLIIADHFNKTGKGDLDLDSIAQAGMSQWADSWMLQRHRVAPNQDEGEFRLSMQFGSRRWGGRNWNLDWKLPSAEAMERGEPGEVSWFIEREGAGDGVTKRSADEVAQDDILQVLRDEPNFSLTATALRDRAGGNRDRTKRVLERLIGDGQVLQRKESWPEQRADGSTKPVVRTRMGLAEPIHSFTMRGRK